MKANLHILYQYVMGPSDSEWEAIGAVFFWPWLIEWNIGHQALVISAGHGQVSSTYWIPDCERTRQSRSTDSWKWQP